MDSFAADVNAKDNAGRTPMATVISRHKAQRPGVGPHAAMKLQLIDTLVAQRKDSDDEGNDSMYSLEDGDDGSGMSSPVSAAGSSKPTV